MKPKSPTKLISKKSRSVRNAPSQHSSFREVMQMIEAARNRAYQAVNTELIDLYWRVGEYISRKIEAAEWRDAVVEKLAAYIKKYNPLLRGFSRPNLFRMCQLY